jgi:aryl sulfotransferase
MKGTSMPNTKPVVHNTYQNHTLDSTRWLHYSPRADDIVIATPYKSGTTWMQIIVMHLVFQDLQVRPINEFSPWFEVRFRDFDDILPRLEGQNHRRFIKTHLPLDGLPYYEQVKYIVVGRDPRDVFMSLWNFYRGFSDDLYEQINSTWGGTPFPHCPDDIHDFWRDWIEKGWFDWETEGFPFWSNMRHVQTWWDYRHLPNILFVHFGELLRDLESEIELVADYLAIDLAPDMRSQIAEAVTFKQVKKNSEQLGRAGDFFHKGTNGRWRGVLSDGELQQYRHAVDRELTPECARWLENGRQQFSGAPVAPAPPTARRRANSGRVAGHVPRLGRSAPEPSST